jgi:CheY-like chemotaxis protein
MKDRASLLLVDDSNAVLNFEKAALSNYYQISTAANGVEALRALRESPPDAVVLDLSMPEMDGDEVLRFIRRDERLKDIGVLILSTEGQRARDCLSQGADDFLLKPSKPEELRAHVAAAVEQALRRAASRQRAFLFFSVGELDLGLNLSEVERVLPMGALSPLPGAPDWMLGWFELYGAPAVAADLASLCGLAHAAPLMDRKLVVLRHEALRLCLCVDEVLDPEELDQSLLEDAQALIPEAAQGLKGQLECLARASKGRFVPVIRGSKFFDEAELLQLASKLSVIGKGVDHGPGEARRPGVRKNRV